MVSDVQSPQQSDDINITELPNRNTSVEKCYSIKSCLTTGKEDI